MTFHVPELRRITPDQHPLLGSDHRCGNNGAFELPSPEPGWVLFLICSDGRDAAAVGDLRAWEHVSVSARRIGKDDQSRVPTWKEMSHVKDRCWDAEDVVVQFHPRRSEYVNQHPHVLHLWRWTAGEFPTPPKVAV